MAPVGVTSVNVTVVPTGTLGTVTVWPSTKVSVPGPLSPRPS